MMRVVPDDMKHRVISVYIATFAVCLLAGCDVIHEHLTGPYILVAIDTDDQLSVSYDLGKGNSVGRIGPVVTDVGWDDHYVVAVVRPKGKPGATPSFYYLDITRDSAYGNQFQAVTGPLSKTEFEAATASLKLPAFKRHFPDLR